MADKDLELKDDDLDLDTVDKNEDDDNKNTDDDLEGDQDKKVEKKEKEKEEEFDIGNFKEEKTDDDEKFGVKDITKKYPKLFEEFPALRTNFFRAKQFSEIFLSIDNAKDAAARAQTLNQIETELLDRHNIKDMLGRVKKADDKAFTAITGKFLFALKELSESDYYKAIIPVLDEAILGLKAAGDARSDDNVRNAALILNMYVHNSKVLPDGSSLKVQEEEKKPDPVEAERLKLLQTRYNHALQTVVERVDHALDSNLDRMVSREKFPKNFVRTKLIEEIKSQVKQGLADDDVHVRNISNLWHKSERLDFSSDSTNEIIGVVLRKVKEILPKIKSRLEAEVLDEQPKKIENDNEDDDSTSGDDNSPRRAREVDWSRTSDLDYLQGKIVYKKGK